MTFCEQIGKLLFRFTSLTYYLSRIVAMYSLLHQLEISLGFQSHIILCIEVTPNNALLLTREATQ